jgi:MFS family permease
MIIYAIGISMIGFSTDILTLIFARTIQGVGISMFPLQYCQGNYSTLLCFIEIINNYYYIIYYIII